MTVTSSVARNLYKKKSEIWLSDYQRIEYYCTTQLGRLGNENGQTRFRQHMFI